jgi:hypothetical protein
MRVSLSDQIITIKRELEFRERVYPKRVEMHAMTRQEADREISRMKATLLTLQTLLNEKREALMKTWEEPK